MIKVLLQAAVFVLERVTAVLEFLYAQLQCIAAFLQSTAPLLRSLLSLLILSLKVLELLLQARAARFLTHHLRLPPFAVLDVYERGGRCHFLLILGPPVVWRNQLLT
jgi:hypothetical protein